MAKLSQALRVQTSEEALMNWGQLIKLGKRATEIGVERLLTAASIVEDLSRGAIDRYNRFADNASVPLPKVPFGSDTESDGGRSWSETSSAPERTPARPSVVPAVDLEEKAATAKQRTTAAVSADVNSQKSTATTHTGAVEATAKPSDSGQSQSGLERLPANWLLEKARKEQLQKYCTERGLPFAEEDIKKTLVTKLIEWRAHGEV